MVLHLCTPLNKYLKYSRVFRRSKLHRVSRIFTPEGLLNILQTVVASVPLQSVTFLSRSRGLLGT